MTFYEQTVGRLMADGVLSPDDRILIVCGGTFDAQVMQAAQLSNVLITNLDDRYDGYCAPYRWDYADAEALKMTDGSFDAKNIQNHLISYKLPLPLFVRL